MIRTQWLMRGAVGFAFVIGSFAGPAMAQAPATAPGAKVLTLDEALQLAARNNLDIARAREYQRYVQGRYIEERAAALPRLTLEASHMKASDETQRIFASAFTGESEGEEGPSFPIAQTTRTAQVGLNQALFTWGQVGAAIRAAKFGLASADDQLRLFRQATVRDVTAAFDDVLLAREMAAIARENVQQKERHLDEAKRKLLAGTATDYDVLAADVALQNARPEAIRAEHAVTLARDRLRFLLAYDGEVDVAGALAAPPERELPGYDAAVGTALSQRADLAEARKRRQVYGELVKIAKAGNKPRLDFAGAYGWKEWDLGIAKTDGATWNAGIYLRFPFFDGLATRGRVRQATSDFATQEIAERKLSEQVELEVRQALQAVTEARQIVAALGGTVQQAERLLQMAEKGFELGVKTRIDVDDAQLNLSSARGNYARALRDLHVAQVTFEFVTGTLPVIGPAPQA